MSSHRSTLSPRLPGSSASSSRTVRPRDYSHLGQPSSSTHDLPVASPPSPARPTTLSSQADELSTGLLGHSTSQSAPTQLELEDLTGCLYLLKRILDDGTPTDGPRRRRRRANERAQEDGRAVVQAVNEMLDRQRNEEGDDQESQDELAHALLTPWPVEHAQAETLSALHLLAHPSVSQTSLLSHPSLVDAVEELWSSGQPLGSSSAGASSPVGAALAQLDELCTPSRLHFLSLTSKLVHLALVLSLLFRPGSLVPDRQDGRPSGSWVLDWCEVLWIIFSLGYVVEIATFAPTSVPLSTSLPLISLLLAIAPSPSINSLSYPLLSISLVPLFLSLISPTAPSLPHLYPSSSLLPISTYTSSLLGRIVKPSLLFLPLAGALFVALAWSLNGDIWRLGVQLPVEPPEEIGVAPFAVRMWLAIALAVVLVGWLMASCSRCGGLGTGEEESLGGQLEVEGVVDPWEAEWGRRSARRARRERVKALRRYLVVSPEVSPPTSNGDAVSTSESQPLLARSSSGSATSSRTRTRSGPLVPLPPPLNLLTLVVATLPSMILKRLPASNPSLRATWATRWESVVERWLWRIVAVVTGLGPWGWIRRGWAGERPR